MAIVKGSIRDSAAVSQSAEDQKTILPAVGSKRLYRPRLTKADLLYRQSRLKTKSLISLLMGYSLRAERLSMPVTSIKLRALTPRGKPAVKIRMK